MLECLQSHRQRFIYSSAGACVHAHKRQHMNFYPQRIMFNKLQRSRKEEIIANKETRKNKFLVS